LFFKGKTQYCPGEVCDVKSKQDIQKTSAAQVFIVALFIAFIVLLNTFFSTSFSKKPYDSFGMYVSEKTKR